MLKVSIREKKYDSKLVLKDFYFEAEAGNVIGLLGHNGAGKSTLMECIYKRRTFDGDISINDQNIDEILNQNPVKISYAPDELEVFPYLSGIEFVEFVTEFQGLKFADLKKEAYDRFVSFGMKDDCLKLISKYSMGMKRKSILISQLITRPELLICDEPTNGLDISSLVYLRDWINELAAAGTIVLIASHNLDFLVKTSDKILLMRCGKEPKSFEGASAEQIEQVYIESRDSD